MPYITFKNEDALYHAEKGSTWSNHKYIRIENGRYIYPEDLKGKTNQKSYQAPTKNDIKDNPLNRETLKNDIVSENGMLDVDAKKKLNKANVSIRLSLEKVVNALKKYAETSANTDLSNIRNKQVNEISDEAFDNIYAFQEAFVEYKDAVRKQISNINKARLQDSDKKSMVDEIVSNYNNYKESIIKIFDASFKPFKETPKTPSKSVENVVGMYTATKELLNEDISSSLQIH